MSIYDCVKFLFNSRRGRYEFVVNTMFGPSIERTLNVWDADDRTLKYWKEFCLDWIEKSEEAWNILRPFPAHGATP